MKFRITVILCVLLSACVAPQQMVWVKPDNTASQEQKDFAECRFEAAKATASASSAVIYDLSAAVVHDQVVLQRRNQLESMCLQAKGYSLQAKAQ